MKRSTFTAALLALALGVPATGASAQPRHHEHDRDRRDGRRDGRDDHGGWRGPDRDDRHHGHDRGRPPHHGHRGPPHHAHRGPPPHAHGRPPHHWRRGERLPPAYRARYYVVDDWRGHRLQRPPRGHHWVQVGADYVLIAIATGVIAQVLLAQ